MRREEVFWEPCWVALLGFLFDYTGTYFIAVVLILMAVILAVHGTVSMRLKSAGEAVGASLDHRRQAMRERKMQRHERKLQKQQEDREGNEKKKQKEQPEHSGVFLNVDDIAARGKVSAA